MSTTIHFSQTIHHEVNMLFSRGVSGLLMYLLAHEVTTFMLKPYLTIARSNSQQKAFFLIYEL